MFSLYYKKSRSFFQVGGFAMKRAFLGLTLVAGLVLSTVPMSAHHSFSAEFDSNKPIKLQGWVTKIDWTNPHVWIYMNVKDKDSGAMASWGFEMGPPHLLQGSGWSRTTLKIGDEVVVEGSMAKNGTKRMNARTVTMAATGQRLGAGSSQNINQ
jgi:Family of unknown function (DUF6152)